MSKDNGSGGEAQMQMRHDHKGGKINIFEPLNTKELMSSPLTVSYFKHVRCLDFCEKVQQIQKHSELTRLFIINFHEKKVNIVRVTFELSTDAIANATGIPSVGENWFK